MTIPNFDFYYEANLLGNPNFNDGGHLFKQSCWLSNTYSNACNGQCSLKKYPLRVPDASTLCKGYVKFVVASLPALFGDLAWGVKVQQWCIQRGWTLLWSLGTIEGGRCFRSGGGGGGITCCSCQDPRVRSHSGVECAAAGPNPNPGAKHKFPSSWEARS